MSQLKKPLSIFLGVLLLVLPGCLSQNGASSTVQALLNIPKDILYDSSSDTKEYEYAPVDRRFYDIFIPESAVAVDISKGNDPRKTMLSFTSEGPLEAILSEYRSEMLYLGWEGLALFDDSHTYACLVFSRPSRICTLTCIPDKSYKYTITICTGSKQVLEA